MSYFENAYNETMAFVKAAAVNYDQLNQVVSILKDNKDDPVGVFAKHPRTFVLGDLDKDLVDDARRRHKLKASTQPGGYLAVDNAAMFHQLKDHGKKSNNYVSPEEYASMVEDILNAAGDTEQEGMKVRSEIRGTTSPHIKTKETVLFPDKEWGSSLLDSEDKIPMPIVRPFNGNNNDNLLQLFTLFKRNFNDVLRDLSNKGGSKSGNRVISSVSKEYRDTFNIDDEYGISKGDAEEVRARFPKNNN